MDQQYRIGTGYDVHRLVKNRELILGGVKIPHELGLLGHSDSDVLVHAIMDALLGALALGDIGQHFPDTDKKYKNISSLDLLKNVNGLILKAGYKIENIDSTIIAQKPKLKSYINLMRKNISRILNIDLNQISIKATTEEGLGFTGTEEGISSQAICLLKLDRKNVRNNYSHRGRVQGTREVIISARQKENSDDDLCER